MQYWTYCMLHCLRLHNALPSSVLPNQISPSERLRSKPPDLSRLRVWGCKSYYHIPKRDRKSKLHPRSEVATYLGWDAQRKGDIIVVHGLNRITTAARLRFREDQYCTENAGARIRADYHYFEDTTIQTVRGERHIHLTGMGFSWPTGVSVTCLNSSSLYANRHAKQSMQQLRIHRRNYDFLSIS
jgi:hypothetical protein